MSGVKQSSSLSGTGRRVRFSAVFLFLICSIAFGLSWAQVCPDDDLDTFADCTVPGCDSTGLTCGDCDDSNGQINPNAIEVCNQADDDCNGVVDDAFNKPTSSIELNDSDYRSGDQFGRSVASLGDVNGDQVPDFAVGAKENDRPNPGMGTAVVFSGADLTEICRVDDPTLAVGSAYGYSMAVPGDVSGDGTNDFVIGSENSSRAVVVSGADCSVIRVDSEPDGLSTRFARSVGAVPDITGDGVPEIVYGAMWDDDVASNAGAAHVIDGATGMRLFKLTDPGGGSTDELGYAVTGMGDVNGDGTADIAVSAPNDDTTATNSGKIVLFSGATGAFIRNLIDTDPVPFSDQVGQSLASLGDVDGDGTDDLAAGAPSGNANKVVIFSGGTGSVIRNLTDPAVLSAGRHGNSVARVPDMTGDGIAEVLAGSYTDNPNGNSQEGSATLYNGATGSVIRTFVDPRGQNSDWIGWVVAAIEDISGDGEPEFLAGGPLADRRENTTGVVIVFSLEADCDGDGQAPYLGDCDDSDDTRFDGNVELCDGVDNDCDVTVDEDEDGDGFDRCADCQPNNPHAFPGAVELCNNIDDDCDTSIDEGDDLDGDGFETPCDCNDGDDTINPNTIETCNKTDENCDGVPDDTFSMPSASLTLRDPLPSSQGRFGGSIAVIGDVNTDGIDDFITGIRGSATHGVVALYSGVTRTEICRASDPNPPASGNELLGSSVDVIADVTGDGVADFIAGAPSRGLPGIGTVGRVFVFSGADCSFVRFMAEESQNHQLGYSVAGLDDVDGDGTADIAAGAPFHDTSVGTSVGRVYVFSGTDGAPIYELEAPDARASDEFGHAITGIDDVDFDGIADIAVAMPADNGPGLGSTTGSVLVFSGADGAFLRRLRDPGQIGTGDRLGESIDSVGDVDGDGVGEIIAGLTGDDDLTTNAGSVLMFSGRTGDVIRRFTDSDGAFSDSLGGSVAGLPDMNGDSVPDLAAAARFDDTAGGANAGSVTVFSGADGSVIRKFTNADSVVNDFLGDAVAGADLTGDGLPEILAGTPNADYASLTNPGHITIFSLESDCDGDGFSPFGGDCDDAEPAVFSGNPEICDDLDNDCNSLVDDGLQDDPELCNGLDDNCNGIVDENNPEGGGSCSTGQLGVCDPGTLQCDAGVLSCFEDRGPGPELCNGLDDDCDGTVDEVTDTDGDGFDDCNDNCLDTYNPAQADGDADGIGDLCDCTPNDNTNPPPPTVGATVMLSNDAQNSTLITWDAVADAETYNTYRGWRIVGDPFEYNQQCLENKSASTSTLDDLVPRKGVAFFYLVSSFCGADSESGLGTDSAGSARPNGDPCPTATLDADGDGWEEANDNCPGFQNTSQSDVDSDSRGDACDNCVNDANTDQADLDGDGLGDVCDPDQDDDGILDDGDSSGTRGDAPCTGGNTVNCDDNCPRHVNPNQEDVDGDGIGDVCDT